LVFLGFSNLRAFVTRVTLDLSSLFVFRQQKDNLPELTPSFVQQTTSVSHNFATIVNYLCLEAVDYVNKKTIFF